MRRATTPRATWHVVRIVCGLAFLWIPVSPAKAQDDAEREIQTAPAVVLTREILEPRERPAAESDWIANHFRTAGEGVEYRQPISFGERQLELNVSAPMLRRRAVGLNFEIRF